MASRGAVALERPLHEGELCLFASGLGDETFEHFTLVVDGATQVMHPAIDIHIQLIEVPHPMAEQQLCQAHALRGSRLFCRLPTSLAGPAVQSVRTVQQVVRICLECWIAGSDLATCQYVLFIFYQANQQEALRFSLRLCAAQLSVESRNCVRARSAG